MLQQYQIPIQQFLNYIRFEKRYSAHTSIAYQNDLEQFTAYLASQYDGINITEVNASIIKSWLAELKTDDITSRSIKRKISSLKSFYKFHLKSGLITKSPMATIISPKVSNRLPSFVAEKDMNTLLNTLDFEDSWNGKTERVVLLTFYHTGMRLSELLGLTADSIDFHYHQIKVLGKGNKERIIPITSDLNDALTEYIQLRKELNPTIKNLFINDKAKAISRSKVYQLVKMNIGKVSTIHKKSPHVLRHTFATHLMNNGAELNAVKELLGHSSLAATQVYTHNTIEKLKETFKKAHPKA